LRKRAASCPQRGWQAEALQHRRAERCHNRRSFSTARSATARVPVTRARNAAAVLSSIISNCNHASTRDWPASPCSPGRSVFARLPRTRRASAFRRRYSAPRPLFDGQPAAPRRRRRAAPLREAAKGSEPQAKLRHRHRAHRVGPIRGIAALHVWVADERLIPPAARCTKGAPAVRGGAGH
jgi:hypothetical protein